jgi:hypothetical protein
MKIIIPLALTVLFFAFSLPQTVHAQLNNKPFSFKGSPDGGVGMSLGGRQAILNKEIFGVTPKNLVRGFDGQLLDVTRGPGHSAIVSHEGGGFIPSYRGSSSFRANEDVSVGVFNSYFSPSQGSSATPVLARLTSSAVISTWTARVATGGTPVSYSPDSSVDAWTGMVHILH